MPQTRNKTLQKCMANKEVVNMFKAIGVKTEYTYDSADQFSTLRYKKLWIFTDQDSDGDHIFGLVLNIFISLFPALVHKHNFIERFCTPVLKAHMKNGDGE